VFELTGGDGLDHRPTALGRRLGELATGAPMPDNPFAFAKSTTA